MADTETPKDTGFDDIVEFPFPHPIALETADIELTKDIPGIIKKDQGTWVKQYLAFKKFGCFLVDIFDNWLENRLEDQLKNITIKLPDGGKIKYLDVHRESPKFKTSSNIKGREYPVPASNAKSEPIHGSDFGDKFLPSHAKALNGTYAVSIYARPTLCYDNGICIPLAADMCYIGDIPLMLGSKYCHLRNMSNKQLLDIGEDPDTSRGYFIVEGKKKIIMNFEKIRLNKPLLYKYTGGEIICRTTFESHSGTSIVELSFDKDKKINIFLSSLNYYDNKIIKGSEKLPRKKKRLNVFYIFRFLTTRSDSTMMDYQEILDKYILPFVGKDHRGRVTAELSHTLIDILTDGEDPIKFFRTKMGAPDLERAREEMIKILEKDLFPTLNDLAPELGYEYKLLNLGFMVARISEYMAGVRQLDNRDLWSNKRLESAGRLMEQFFRILWNHLLKKALEEEMKIRYNNPQMKIPKDLTGSDKKTIGPDKIQPSFLLEILPQFPNVSGNGNYYIDLAKKIVSKVKYSNVTELFKNAFAKGWQIRGVYRKENVVQELKTDNKLAALSHLVRIDIESSHQGTVQDIRHIQADQYGFICSVHTPEGGPCGLVKNMAVTALISKGLPPNMERSLIEKLTALKYRQEIENRQGGRDSAKSSTWMLSRNPEGKEFIRIKGEGGVEKEVEPDVFIFPDSERKLTGKFFLNGRFLGWCDPESLYNKIYAMKVNVNSNEKRGSTQEIITPETSVSRDRDDNINVYTDNSRLIRPLFLVNNKDGYDADLIYNDLKRANPNKHLNFDDLIRLGAATYVDPEEQKYIKLASFASNIKEYFSEQKAARDELDRAKAELNTAKNGNNIKVREIKILEWELEKQERKFERLTSENHRRYTHCELHPQALLGVSASVIPLPQTDQAARATFQANMATQALSIYHANQRNHFDGKTKLLAYPSNPILSTEMESVYGMDSTPQGQNVIIAFSSHLGMTGEDAFIFNRRSIDLGLFQIVKYIPFTAVIMSRDRGGDTLRKPRKESGEITDREEEFYHAINENGLPSINAELKSGDVVISIFRTDPGTGVAMANPIVMGTLEDGIVDSVKVTERPDGNKIVRVVLRKFRQPKVGDKFAARNAQKGTIGAILNAEDMPWTASGMTPDVIVNPHSIPGRMTMEYMIELLTGKVGAVTGERINGTPYEPIDLDRFFEILRELGYNQSGKEIMYSGTTGKPLKIPIYIGPAFFQALRHHVDDKYQARGKKGGIKAVTHQPTEGRSKGGGIRFGEMERDAMLGHGASFFLKERLCDLSDAFKTVACSNCGNFAVPKVKQDEIVCRNCTGSQSKDQFGQITVPYAFTLLRNLLAGLNIEMKFDFKDQTYIVGDTFAEEAAREDFEELSDVVDQELDENLRPGDEDDYDEEQSGDDEDYEYEDEFADEEE